MPENTPSDAVAEYLTADEPRSLAWALDPEGAAARLQAEIDADAARSPEDKALRERIAVNLCSWYLYPMDTVDELRADFPDAVQGLLAKADELIAMVRAGGASLPQPRDLPAELVDRGDGLHVSPETLVDAFLAGQLDVDLNAQRPYVFSAGPWAGRVTLEPRAMLPQHCLPVDDVAATWAAADSWPGRERYVPDRTCAGDAVRMVWRFPTVEEQQAAARRREERYADKSGLWGDE